MQNYILLIRHYLFFILGLFLSFSLFAQSREVFPSLEPLFSYDAGAELSGEDFIRAGLEFSLCPAESDAGKAVLAQYKILENEVKSENFLTLSESERGEKILSLMYEKVLSQYSLNQTYIDIMFQKGTYNCVSSSILYFALAKAADLRIHGVETPDHAFCTLYLSDGQKIDVETTNPYGFNPGKKRDVSTSQNSKRYLVVPKKYYSNRHEISGRKFISLIGKNVTAMSDEKRNYERAIPVAAARIAFLAAENLPADDKKAVRTDFDTVTTNYAVQLDRQKKSDLALDWLDSVENRWGKTENPVVQKLYDSISYNCAANLSNANQAERAREIFESKKTKISEKQRVEIQNMIFYSLLNEKTKTLSAEEAILQIQEARKEPEAKDKNIARKIDALEEYYWSEKAKPLSRQGKYLEAAEIISDGLKSLPNSRNLQTIRNQNLNNYAVGIHNQFVTHFNAKRFDEAEKILKEGLEILPKNGNLLNDLKILQRQKR